MNNKLTIAALAVMIPLALAPGARAEGFSLDASLWAEAACAANKPECTPDLRKIIEHLAELCGPIKALTECLPLLNPVIFEMEQVEQKKALRATEAAQKRASGDLPQTDWRVSKPANDWKVSR
jgi:hypothetical protein